MPLYVSSAQTEYLASMGSRFHVDILTFSLMKEIPGVWTTKAYTDLLQEMEFGPVNNLSESEVKEMCLLSLQELEPEAAAVLVLKYYLGDRLRDGQIAAIANDMLDEKPWEGGADMSMHEHLFSVSSLIYQAFPNVFPEPDAVRVRFNVTALHEDGKKMLRGKITEAFLIRLLAAGMDANVALHRLFEKQLAGARFTDAESIFWILDIESISPEVISVEVTSSGSWLDPLRDTKSFSAQAFPDA